MRLAYFPGCAAVGTGRELNSSVSAACAAYGIELVDIPGWVCCGASAAHMTSAALARSLPAVSLGKARQLGADGLLTACAACYNRLKLAELEIRDNPRVRAECEEATRAKLDGELAIYHAVEVFDPARLGALLATPTSVAPRLKGLKVACYYGCLLTRPKTVSVDPDPVNPSLMDDLVRACGLDTVDWPFKTECCGASMVLPRPESVSRLTGRLLDAAAACGAEAVVVACPLCHANLDLKQPTARRASANPVPIPVLYLTEVLALALGVPGSKLDLRRHTVPVPALV